MENVIVNYQQKPDITSPVLIDGLPGVGNVCSENSRKDPWANWEGKKNPRISIG